MSYTIYEIAKQVARDLRKKQANAESRLWSVLRNRQFLGKKFLRQYPIIFKCQSVKKFFIADFYCHEEKLVIEIDGKSHDYQRDYDEMRTYIINELGIRVVRFKNEEIENDIEKVLGELKRLIKK